MPEFPMAEPRPTRRSSRTAPTPVQAPAVTPGTSRSEMRRNAQAAAPRPATVWDQTDVAETVAATVISAAALAPAAVPATRRSARSARTTTTSVEATPTQEQPVVEQLVFDEPAPSPAEESDAAESSSVPDSAASVDEFEAAARLFSFTAETPIQTAPLIDENDKNVEDIAARVAASGETGARRGSFKRVAAASFSVGVLGIVGLLTVGLTTPAEAVAAAAGTTTAGMTALAPAGGDVDTAASEIQAYVTPTDLQSVEVSRSENYETETMAQIASDSGISNFSDFFTSDPTSAIQWPFAVGVPISYGFGMRSGRMHEGVDFTPGAGSPVQAIADGTVRIATESGGAYGVTVVIDHVIDGQLVSSRYGHMEYGSLQVVQGQKITVGTVIGRTGNTGRSFGAHTHVEILLGGTTAIDPIPWFREHAGG